MQEQKIIKIYNKENITYDEDLFIKIACEYMNLYDPADKKIYYTPINLFNSSSKTAENKLNTNNKK